MSKGFRIPKWLCLILFSLPLFAQSGGLVNGTRGFPVPNDATTGTALNATAVIDAAGQAITAGTSNTGVPTYVVVGGAGIFGHAVLASAGSLAACTMDTTIASAAGGYYVVNSTTVAGDCHAQSAAPANGTWVIGFLDASSTTAGSAALVNVSGLIYGGIASSGSVQGVVVSGIPTAYTDAAGLGNAVADAISANSGSPQSYDATSFSGVQTWGVNLPNITNLGQLKLPCATITNTFGTIVQSDIFNVFGCNGGNGGTKFQWGASLSLATNTAMWAFNNAGNPGNIYGSRLESMDFECGGKANSIGLNNNQAQELSEIAFVRTNNCPVAGFQISNTDGTYSSHDQNVHIQDVEGYMMSNTCTPTTDDLYVNGDMNVEIDKGTFSYSGCTTAPAEVARVSSVGFTGINLHLQSGASLTNVNGIVIGKDRASTNIFFEGTGFASFGTGTAQGGCGFVISNANSVKSLVLENTHSGNSGLTNLICDQINGNTITVANNPNLARYWLDASGAAYMEGGNCSDMSNGWCLANGNWTYYSGGATVYSVTGSTGTLAAANGSFSSSLIAPTPATADNSTKVATTAYVQSQGYGTASGLVTGNYGKAAGPAAMSDSGVAAGPYAVFWAIPGSVSTSTPIACSNTASKATVWGVSIPFPIRTSNVTYYVVSPDNSGNTYDLGLYNAAGSLVTHTGSLAGSSFAPTANHYTTQAWTTANTVIQPGDYWLALACSATSGTATFGYAYTWTNAPNTLESLATGGTLSNSITVPGANSFSNASSLQVVIY
jgi:hypothetical protein